MPTLRQQIVEKFLGALTESQAIDAKRLEKMRVLLKETKRPKADDLVAIFSEPTDGDIK